MPTALAPTSFYGDKVVSMDTIQRLRISRLISSTGSSTSSTSSAKTGSTFEKKQHRSTSRSKSRYAGIKLNPRLSHGVKKAKHKTLANKRAAMVSVKTTSTSQSLLPDGRTKKKTAAAPSIRRKILDKFDFSRTPYAVIKRIELNEDECKKRKFFKRTVQTTNSSCQKTNAEESVDVIDFDCADDNVEKCFEDINKDVSNILDEKSWSDDDDLDFFKPAPGITKKVADEMIDSSPLSSNASRSYIAFSALQPKSDQENVHNKKKSSPTSPSRHLLSGNEGDIPIGVPTVNIAATNTSCVEPLNLIENEVPSTPKNDSITNKNTKLFPVFDKTNRNILTDVTNKKEKKRTGLIKAAAASDQYQIDAGQKAIGPRTCPTCQMVYDIGDPVDIIRHDKHHKKQIELKFPITKTDKIVGVCGTDRITMVKYSDGEAKRKKVADVLRATEQDIGSGYTFTVSSTAFLYIRNDAILGCLITEPNVMAGRLIDSNGILLVSEDMRKIKCGINRIWVKSSSRRQNIATNLLNCLRKNYIFGEYLSIDDIAFSVTTLAGNAFAKKYTGRNDYYTYLSSLPVTFDDGKL